MARGKTRKRQRAQKQNEAVAAPEIVEEVVGEVAEKGGRFGRLLSWKGLVGTAGAVGMSYALSALLGDDESDQSLEGQLKRKGRGELQTLLKKLKTDTATGTEVAAEQISGLDSLLRGEREVAFQAPPGTQAATPLLNRLGVLMPEFLTTLRQRMGTSRGDLWAELAEGEVLVDGAGGSPSRSQRAAEDQDLEVALREELGFAPTPSPDSGVSAQALMA